MTGLESLNQVKISFVKVSLRSAYGLRDVLSLSTEIIKEIVFLLVFNRKECFIILRCLNQDKNIPHMVVCIVATAHR